MFNTFIHWFSNYRYGQPPFIMDGMIINNFDSTVDVDLITAIPERLSYLKTGKGPAVDILREVIIKYVNKEAFNFSVGFNDLNLERNGHNFILDKRLTMVILFRELYKTWKINRCTNRYYVYRHIVDRGSVLDAAALTAELTDIGLNHYRTVDLQQAASHFMAFYGNSYFIFLMSKRNAYVFDYVSVCFVRRRSNSVI